MKTIWKKSVRKRSLLICQRVNLFSAKPKRAPYIIAAIFAGRDTSLEGEFLS